MTGRTIRAATLAMVVALAADLLPTPAIIPVAAAEPELVAHWTFEEGAGTTATDTVGGNVGTVSGDAHWLGAADAAVGSGAMGFDGAGRIIVPHAAELEPTGPFTIALWAGGIHHAGYVDLLLSKNSYGCNWASWNVGMSDETFGTILQTGGGSQAGWSTGRPDLWDGATWHALALVADPATGHLDLYVDGVLQRTDIGPFAIQYGEEGRTSRAMRMGHWPAGCGHPGLDGAIDDVRIYDGALDGDAVRALMPQQETTTTVTVRNGDGQVVSTVYPDEYRRFYASVDPAPGVAGSVTWYRTVNGGTEEAFWTSDLPAGVGTVSIDDLQLFPPGSYTLRAAWGGASIWEPSSSSAIPFTVARRPVVLDLTADPQTPYPNEGVTLSARMTVPSAPQSPFGLVTFFDITGPTDVEIGSVEPDNQGSSSVATLAVPGVATGSRTYEARFVGSDAFTTPTDTVTVTTGRQQVVLAAHQGPPADSSERATVFTRVTGTRIGAATVPALPVTGRVQVRLLPSGASVGSRIVFGTDYYVRLALPYLAAGTYDVEFTYLGDANYAPATTVLHDLVIEPNTIEASAVGRDYGTFYPYRDQYRDSVSIRGTRSEDLSAKIEVFAPGGSRVATTTIPSGTGAYAWSWNGRNSAGSILGEGSYTIKQTLTDSAGLQAVFTTTTSINHARLETVTAYVSKSGHQVSAQGDEGAGSITLSSSGGYAKLVGGWVGVGYEFTLPTAIEYRSLEFQIYFRGYAWAGPTNQMAVQDFESCPYNASADWNAGCFESWSGVGDQNTPKWFTTDADVVRNRSGRIVRGMVGINMGTTYVYTARFKVVYTRLTG